MPTHIDFAEGHESNSTPRPSLSTSTSLTVQVGDGIIVPIGFEQTAVAGISITGITDGLGNTYQFLRRVNHATQTDMAAAIFACIVANAGTATPQVAWGSNVTYCHIEAFQARPDSGKVFQLDNDAGGQSPTQNTIATTSAMTVDAPGYAVAGAKFYSTGNMSSAWGVELGALTGVDFAGAYKLTSADGDETPEITTSNGTSWAILAAHLKEVDAGGGASGAGDARAASSATAQGASFLSNPNILVMNRRQVFVTNKIVQF